MRFYDIGGVSYPSVTTILDVLPKPTPLKLFIENNPNAKFIAAERAYIGTLSHFYFETMNAKMLGKVPELEKVDYQFDTETNRDIIQDIETKIKFFMIDNDLIPMFLEKKLWNNKLKIAGRVDFVGHVNNKLSILDLKTSKMFYKSDTDFDSHSIQLSMYKMCLEEMTDLIVEKLYILRCHEDSWWEMKEKKFNSKDVFYARKLFKEKYGC